MLSIKQLLLNWIGVFHYKNFVNIQRKSCVKTAQTVRIASGVIIHKAAFQLWTQTAKAQLSPNPSPAYPALCTQIMHSLSHKITSVILPFSAPSTAITTTTTIYIHNKRGII